MIQVRKVIEHVYEKVLRQGVENGHQSGESGDHEKEAQDISKLAAEKVELLCNDQVQIILKQIRFVSWNLLYYLDFGKWSWLCYKCEYILSMFIVNMFYYCFCITL